jgi:uncharacterized protein DUF3108
LRAVVQRIPTADLCILAAGLRALHRSMALTFLGQPLSSATSRRIALVLAIVLSLHACGLYEVAVGLSRLKPEDATQTTLTVSLLAPPPPPPTTTPAPAPPRPPRPRSDTAPSLPAPPAAPTPPPAPPAPPEPAPPPTEAPPPQPAQPPTTEEARLPPGVVSLPTSGRIAYRTSYTRLRGVTAMTFVDWNVDPARARYELWLRTVDPAGLLDLKSSGMLRPFGIAPERYVERIEIANRELRAEFDWSSHMVAFAGRYAGPPAAFIDGTQDPLSLQFHLPLLAQAYPWRFTPGSVVEFDIARRDVEHYVFRVEAYEAVKVGEREVQAVKLERARGPGANRRVEMWMAPEFQWLPIRLRFTDTNDEVWDSVLAVLPGGEMPREPIQQEPVKP